MHSLPLKNGGEHHEDTENSCTRSSTQHDVPCEVNNMDSSNPSDPQTWPAHRKRMTYYPVCFFSFLATVNTSKFTVAVIPVAKEFQVANGTAGYLVSFSVLALGIGNFLSMVMLRKLGRRLTFLIFIPVLAAANAWSSRAQSFGSLMAATILSSLASGAGEAPVATITADLYSVRERGSAMMVFNIALSAGFFVGPLINSTIAEFVGWRWVCGWIGIASIVLWLVTFGMVHETCSYPQGQLNDGNLLPETLSLKAGYNRDMSLVTAATNTIYVVAYPSVLWAGITIGVFVGWNVVVQLTASRVLHLPPYNFDLYRIGLVMLSGFIGSVLAIFFGGRLIDVIANRMTDRAQGKREAEYRLPGLLLPAIIGPLGVLTFGLCAAKQLSWTGLAFGCGMQGFGLTAGSNVLVTYAVDCYVQLSGEVTVFIFIARGLSGCFLSMFSYDWIKSAGMENAFGQMVAVEYVFLLIGIVFMIYGGKIRSWTSSFGPVAAGM